MLLLQRSSWRAMLFGSTLITLMLPATWALHREAQAAKEEGMPQWGIYQWEKMPLLRSQQKAVMSRRYITWMSQKELL